MKTLMLSITMGLVLIWAAAFIERVDSIAYLRREPSIWSLLLVTGLLCLQLILLYTEGAVL